MERLTFDGLFCDIAICQEVPCKYPDTGCSQRQVWERLKQFEDIFGSNYDFSRLKELAEADSDGRCAEVVRCKDCKYYFEIAMSIPVCTLIDHKFRKPDDFCSYGKREAAEKALEGRNG